MIHAIVADNRRVRLFEAVADRAPIELVIFANPAGGKLERDLVSDRPGRRVNTASGAHQTLQNHSPASEHALQLWLKSIAPPLREMLEARSSTGLILFASPRLLSMLRRCLPAPVRRLVRNEVTLDLARQPSGALRKRIEPTLRVTGKQLAKPELIHRSHRVRKLSARPASE